MYGSFGNRKEIERIKKKYFTNEIYISSDLRKQLITEMEKFGFFSKMKSVFSKDWKRLIGEVDLTQQLGY